VRARRIGDVWMRRVHLRGRDNILKRLPVHGAAFRRSCGKSWEWASPGGYKGGLFAAPAAHFALVLMALSDTSAGGAEDQRTLHRKVTIFPGNSPSSRCPKNTHCCHEAASLRHSRNPPLLNPKAGLLPSHMSAKNPLPPVSSCAGTCAIVGTDEYSDPTRPGVQASRKGRSGRSYDPGLRRAARPRRRSRGGGA